MAAENYLFEFGGVQFNITIDVDDVVTTSEQPNIRVIEGAWKTWRLTVDHETSGIAGVHLARSTTGSNLTPAESASKGSMLMVTQAGHLYGVPSGSGVLARLMTPGEWQAQLAEWEAGIGS